MFANLSGYLTGLLYGFTGIRMSLDEPETWSERPVTFPEGWKGIHVERIWARGAARQLDAVGGTDHAALTAAEG